MKIGLIRGDTILGFVSPFYVAVQPIENCPQCRKVTEKGDTKLQTVSPDFTHKKPTPPKKPPKIGCKPNENKGGGFFGGNSAEKNTLWLEKKKWQKFVALALAELTRSLLFLRVRGTSAAQVLPPEDLGIFFPRRRACTYSKPLLPPGFVSPFRVACRLPNGEGAFTCWKRRWSTTRDVPRAEAVRRAVA